MPNFHPIFIHFPIALLSLSLLLEIFAVLLRREDLSRMGWLLQLCGSGGIVLAVISGLQARAAISIPEAATEHIEMHEQLGFVVATLFAGLLLWRIGTKGRIPIQGQRWFYALFAVGVSAMWVGAWYGGLLVYYFGVGVRTSIP